MPQLRGSARKVVRVTRRDGVLIAYLESRECDVGSRRWRLARRCLSKRRLPWSFCIWATSLWFRNVAPVILVRRELNQDVVAVIALVPDHFATRVFMLLRSQHSALFASSCDLSFCPAYPVGSLCHPSRRLREACTAITAPSPLMSTACSGVRHIRVHDAPLFIFMIFFGVRIHPAFLWPLLVQLCNVRSARLFDTTPCAQAPSNTIRSFPPCLTND